MMVSEKPSVSSSPMPNRGMSEIFSTRPSSVGPPPKRRVTSSPVVAAGQVFFGSDDGKVCGVSGDPPPWGQWDVFVWDEAGKRYIDWSSQLINVNVGHGHPHVIKAIQEQAGQFCFIVQSQQDTPGCGDAAARKGIMTRPGILLVLVSLDEQYRFLGTAADDNAHRSFGGGF